MNTFWIPAVFFILYGCQFSETASNNADGTRSSGKSLLSGEIIKEPEIGTALDSLNGVPVYYNGLDYTLGYGKHFAKDRYYYGQKWQCVEFVKRYYHDHYQHKMPNVYGHAKDFFSPQISHGQLNPDRDLVQFYNGKETKPRIGDLVVFQNSTYGHVAIIAKVENSFVELIQQNILGKPRERLPFTQKNNKYIIGNSYQPVGWLRKK